ncbi:hypothetical protein BDZ85DRAFT_221317 [Elsinoe ampelina]|uniref:UBA/TS-N domain-containing protein n=1 Tax=Elsinoe ampelina TaxID=302913 RepID=A0A6A6G759_9PEZI|nr:hypothetical protein BDZ85DRAFT_221317 [Elsinoe ampelina]
MADSGDMNPPVLNLTADEKRVFSQLFQQADTDRLGVVTGEVAVKFFEKTKLAPNVLGEIWQLADTENRGLLTKAGFCVALRLIAHYQAGRDPTPELAFKPGGIPKFDGVNLAPTSPAVANAPPNPLQAQGSGIRIPPIVPEKAAQYSGLFERSGAQSGLLSGESARAIFERAGLPNEILGRIWGLADREQKGALDITEFIIAMHLITSFKSRTMTALPSALPPGLYEAAQRRGQPGPRPQGPPSAVSRQFTGPQRTSSPLARPPYSTAPSQVPQTTSSNWLITPQEKAKYDQFFDNIDTNRSGFLTGEQAVKFFGDSGLSEEILASIWDLADIRSEGQLNRDEFAVAMYLIRQSRSGTSLPAFLPAALVPPAMRNQQGQSQPPSVSTAPNFEAAANSSPQLPKSAADDLFGLDSSPVKAAPTQTIQTTGGSAAGKSPFDTDPFSNDKAPPFTPQFTGPSGPSSVFKPFQPTSAFGASLAVQNTGGSATSSQPQARSPQIAQQAANDDLLGDNDEEQSRKLSGDTAELANMSSQIGNLRTQMQDVQSKRSTNERDVANTNSQKQELQQRLAQFRSQYEQEVQTVKSLEQQLASSRTETRKLQQELAMLEGSHQDLQSQHAQISQALEADRNENGNLKTRISQLNTEISQLRPQIDKMKSEARQQKGMVAINKKQLTTNEGERDKLNNELSDLQKSHELEQARSVTASPTPASSVASPAPSVNTNPFFRKPSGPAPVENVPSGVQSPTTGFLAGAPSPSAFDALFGPPASKSHTPPPVSFNRSDAEQSRSISSGRPTPTASPPPVIRSLSPSGGEAPPPPESRQFTPGMLPIHSTGSGSGSVTSSTKAVPPASAIDAVSTNNTGPSVTSSRGFGSSPFDEDAPSGISTSAPNNEAQRPGMIGNPSVLSLSKDAIPGAFPDDGSPQKAPTQAVPASNTDFDAAFADFGKPAASNDGNADVFGPRGATSKADEQFYPMTEPADDSSSDDEDEGGFDDNFGTPTPKANGAAITERPATEDTARAHPPPAIQTTSEPPPPEDAQQSPPPYAPKSNGKANFPDEFDGLLPAREDPTASPHLHSVPSNPAHASTPSGGSSMFPGSATSDVFQDASSRPLSTWDDTPAGPTPASAPPKSSNAFDEFDDFADLSEAKAADDSSKFDFPDNQSDAEFNPMFDSPAASMTTAGMASSQQTPQPAQSNGFSDFGRSDIDSAFAARSGSGNTSATGQGSHDWDAIFSGLDTSAQAPSKTLASPEVGSSTRQPDESVTPKATSPTAATGMSLSRPDVERTMSESSEHDDPILKRLTGMGYTRQKALDALEKYDYDINKAVDHLTSSA